MTKRAAASSRLITPKPIVRLESGSCGDLLRVFVPRPGRIAIEVSVGVRAIQVTRKSLIWNVAAHLRGDRRCAFYPTLTNDRCRWGALDLDAHDDGTPDRHADAVATVDILDREDVRAYMNVSRGGRGAHVWLFFDPPGVPVRDLFAWLTACANGLRCNGPVDTFPSSPSGAGRAIFLPGFGGEVDLLDVDLKHVPLDKLDANPPEVIPHVPAWPPSYWRCGTSSGEGAAFRSLVANLRAEGTVFGPWTQPHARLGARNHIAWAVALDIVRRGGTFADFVAWDQGNKPPLATDEPGALRCKWRWAQGRAG